MAKDPTPEKPTLNIWPGDDADAGSTLAGTIMEYDPTGGQGAQGFLDIINDGGEQIRHYLNKPGRTALNWAMRKNGMVEDDLPESRIVIRFDGWATGKQSGRKYRDFAMGLAKYEPDVPKGKG